MKRREARNKAQKKYLDTKRAAADQVVTTDQVTDAAQPEPVNPQPTTNPFAFLTDIDADDLPAVTPEQRAAAAVEWDRIKAERAARSAPTALVNPFLGLVEKIAAQSAPTALVNPFAGITPERIAEVTAQSAEKSPQL